MDDEETRKLFEQLGEDQRSAGIASIADAVARFRHALMDRGFEHKESFEMSRDFLIEIMERTGTGDDSDDD